MDGIWAEVVKQEAVAVMPDVTAWADMPAEGPTMMDPTDTTGHMVDRTMAVHMTME